MRRLYFTVPESFEGILLKAFLRKRCGVSSGLLAELKREPEGILRNGSPAIATDILHAGDLLCLFLQSEPCGAVPAELSFSEVYGDEDLLILQKPAGMPMYPCPGHTRDSLANAVAFRCLKTGEPFAFRPVYRLDRDTTGLVVLAKNRYAASRLAGGVEKTYLAVCEGILPESGRIDEPIGLKPGHSIQRAVTEDGQRASTVWHTLQTGGSRSLVALTLETGRTHQIRVHLSHLGHPLAGDDMYGGSLARIGRQALHCAEVRFKHPVSGRRLSFSSALPKDMEALMCNMNKNREYTGLNV